MARKACLLILGAFILSAFCALESRAEFSVTISDSNNYLDFGSMKPGDNGRLAIKGGYHHTIHCVSTNGRIWYLKMAVIRPFSFGVKTIPMENMAVVVEQLLSGQGIVFNGTNREIPLTSPQTIIYTSALEDNNGQAVEMNMYYTLKIPENQIAGSYVANLQYVMVEKI